MASNPPYQVEDQTDDDFFDKLVDDEDEITLTSSAAPNFGDGNDSDETKAFANLTIGEVGGDIKDPGIKDGDGTRDGGTAEDVSSFPMDAHVDDPILSSNSLGVDSFVESSNDVMGSEITSDLTTSKSNGSPGSDVKEVQWSAFHTDAAENGGAGFGSYSDFFSELGDPALNPPQNTEGHLSSESNFVSGGEEHKSAYPDNAHDHGQYQVSQDYGEKAEQSTDAQDLNNSQYWENLYPGWAFDANTGQWYQVEGYEASANVQGTNDTNSAVSYAANTGQWYQAAVQGNTVSNSASKWGVSDGISEVSYLQQQSPQTFAETVTDGGTTESVSTWNDVAQESGKIEAVSSWNQVSQENSEYPAHMVFDPQYPGWYYDTVAQEWRTLETYTSSVQSAVQSHDQLNSSVQTTVQSHDQLNQNGFVSSSNFSHENNHTTYGDHGQVSNYGSQGSGVQGQDYNWAGSYNNYNQQALNTWQPEAAMKSGLPSNNGGEQQFQNPSISSFSSNNHASQQNTYDSRKTLPSHEKPSESHNEFAAITGSHGFVTGGNFSQQFNQPRFEQHEQVHGSNDYYMNQNSVKNSQQQFQTSHQFSYGTNVGRSSAGRPPHTLVTFGFGGKLVVMKDNGSSNTSAYGHSNPVGGSISILNLIEVVTEGADKSSRGECDYFHSLCRQSFPGPLVGGNVGHKELNKWIDERIVNCESPEVDRRKGEVLRLLFSLLKIACQHYGKLRSPFGTDTTQKEGDTPESALAKLFASAKKSAVQFSEYGALSHCLQKLPSEGQMQATAAEVQKLLVSGRKKEALQFAQQGQLWGPALVLAAQLGDQFYVDTVKQMALCQLVAGSPLRTLCLLIAGQPAEVFSSDSTSCNGIPGAVNTSQQLGQIGSNIMLDDWEENLAVITANRTKDDELVLIHLGDCLWKERSEIAAAHICYLVAEANFESYSDSARLCLIGADHWKFPRTFVTPEAIQRTELYEYSKVLGNSQFSLLQFQPYKLIYAHMLAEVGKISESLKYCQAVLKSLKTGRAPEVETWRQLVSSLEERIKAHQQGGYSTNLAPGKLVGKLLNLFDSTAQRVVGGLPPPVPSTSHGGVQVNEHYHQTMVPRVSTSQSTMAMSSLIPSSASMEPISKWTAGGDKMTMHNRSVSEPDFGRTPRQVDISKEDASSNTQGKASGSAGASRFGRFSFGSQLFQKTVGLVLKPRQERQAKLGEKNKFYYDENLKRWVEEGVDPPAEEAVLAPPPTASEFQNGTSNYNLSHALKSEVSNSNGSPEYHNQASAERNSGIPPIPPTSNQFSARGRMGVRSRYVDTFNQGGGKSTNLFHSPSPSVPSTKSTGAGNPKFFVPTPVSSGVQTFDNVTESMQETASTSENSSVSTVNDSFQSPTPPSASGMQRFPSMGTITNKGMMQNGSLSSQSRRTASWSGSLNGAFSPPFSSPPQKTEPKPLGEVLGMPPSSFMPIDAPQMMAVNGSGSFGEDLHEVEL